MEEGAYKKVSALVNDWLDIHVGESFDLDIICRQLELNERNNRKYVAIELAREVSRARPRIEKNNKIYRYIDTVHILDVRKDTPIKLVDLKFPKDSSGKTFGLEYARIFPQSTMTLAGEKDNAKTAFCLNFVKENLDKQCVYHTNEMCREELLDRLNKFPDSDIFFKEDGTLKFVAVEQFTNWHDVVRQYPDAIHVIDYLDPGEVAYSIGTFIDQIRQKLKGGVALIAIQKKQSTSTKKDGTTYRNFIDYGVGGQYSEHRARIVIHLHNKNELYIKSVKSWHTKNPNGKIFKFGLIDGAQFTNIKEIVPDYEDIPDVYRGGD